MRRYGWWRQQTYSSANHNSDKAIAKTRKIAKKRAMQPVVLEARGYKIATSVWGQAWCENLESYSDYTSRLARGRTYVRENAVADLQLEEGKIKALVRGRDLYHVTIDVAPVSAEAWQTIRSASMGQIDSLIDLVDGNLSENVMSVVTRQHVGLFPSPDQIEMHCSCPDWAVMCKHVAAVLYGVGARLDEDPKLLFKLRGVDPSELVAGVLDDVHDSQDVEITHGKRLDLDSAGLGAIFGVELEHGAAKKRRKREKNGLDAVDNLPQNVSALTGALVSRKFASTLEQDAYPTWTREQLRNRPAALASLAIIDSWRRYADQMQKGRIWTEYPKREATWDEAREAWARHVLASEMSPVITMGWGTDYHEAAGPANQVLFAHLIAARKEQRFIARKTLGPMPTYKQRRTAEAEFIDELNEWLEEDASVILVGRSRFGEDALAEVLDFMGWRYVLERRPGSGEKIDNVPPHYEFESLEVRRRENVQVNGQDEPLPVVLSCHKVEMVGKKGKMRRVVEETPWELATNMTVAGEQEIIGLHRLAHKVRLPTFGLLSVSWGEHEPVEHAPKDIRWLTLHEQVALCLGEVIHRAMSETGAGKRKDSSRAEARILREMDGLIKRMVENKTLEYSWSQVEEYIERDKTLYLDKLAKLSWDRLIVDPGAMLSKLTEQQGDELLARLEELATERCAVILKDAPDHS